MSRNPSAAVRLSQLYSSDEDLFRQLLLSWYVITLIARCIDLRSLYANRVSPDEWLSWSAVNRHWNRILSSPELWATAPSFNRLLGEVLTFQLKHVLVDHPYAQFIRGSRPHAQFIPNSAMDSSVPVFQILLPRIHEEKIREASLATEAALSRFQSVCDAPTLELVKTALAATETGRRLLSRETKVPNLDIDEIDTKIEVDAHRTIDIKTPNISSVDIKLEIEPDEADRSRSLPFDGFVTRDMTVVEERDVQLMRDFITALAGVPVTAETASLTNALQASLLAREVKTPTAQRQSAFDVFVAGGGSDYFDVALLMETKNATVKWQPNEFSLSEPEMVGLPESVLFVQWLGSNAGPYSLRRMLCGTAKCTSKKRFMACRRFWWHKIQQLRAEGALRHWDTNEKTRTKSQCEHICLALRHYYRCFQEVFAAIFCVLLILAMIASIFMIPFQVAGIMSSRWIYMFIPWLIGFALVTPSLIGFTLVPFFYDPLSRLRIWRAEYWHLNGAVRAAQGADFTDPSFAVRQIDPGVRISRWQWAGREPLRWPRGPFACLGAIMSVIGLILKSDGGLIGWQWQSVLALATAPLLCGQMAVLVSWMLIRWGGPPLDAHAQLEMKTSVRSCENLSVWLLLGELWALGAQLDDPSRPLYGWVLVFVLLWLLLILDLGLWVPALQLSRLDRTLQCIAGCYYYLMILSPILIFSALLFHHVASGGISNILLVWVPLWPILPLLVIYVWCIS
jgi:hypothetical protein